MAKRPLIYLASPYAHTDPAVRGERMIAAASVTRKLLAVGLDTFSPIVHSSMLHTDDGVSHSRWMLLDINILARCDMLLVLRLPKWEYSKGVAEEIVFGKNHGIPTEYLDLDDPIYSNMFENVC